jgi:hypothetical protein
VVRPSLGIIVERSTVRAVAVARGRLIWAGETRCGGAADLAEVLATLAASAPREAKRATVALGGTIAFVKVIAGLPPLSGADLAAHVQLRSRRYFLQNGVPLVTNAEAVRERGKPTGTALLIAAEAPWVEAANAGLAAAGLACRGVVPARLLPPATIASSLELEGAVAAAVAARLPLELASDATRLARSRRQRRTTACVLAAATAAVVVAGGGWLGSTVWRLRAAERELARLGPEIASALALRRDLDDATAALAIIAAQEAARSRHARLLAHLALALPDSAFISTLRLAGSGVLTGYAHRAATVPAALQRLPGFIGVAPDGPVTSEATGGRSWERFTLRFGWRP